MKLQTAHKLLGGRAPSSRVSVPPLRFSVSPSRFRRPPIESSALDDQRKNFQPGLKDSANFLPKNGRKLRQRLFFCLYLISGKNDFNFRQRPLHSISATEIHHFHQTFCNVGQGYKSVPPCKILQFKY